MAEEFEAAKDCTCISWNQSPFEAPTMVVGSHAAAKVWEFHEKSRRWQCVLELDGHTGTVHDVAWAPNLGRTYHLVATACKDGVVRIFKIRFDLTTCVSSRRRWGGVFHFLFNISSILFPLALASWRFAHLPSSGKHRHELVAELARRGAVAEVWRVEWNVSGTMLASSGDDGVVSLWRPDARGQWTLSCAVSGQSQAAAAVATAAASSTDLYAGDEKS